MYLERTDKANGALRVVPGSHLEGEVPHGPGIGEWANGECVELLHSPCLVDLGSSKPSSHL